MKKSRHRPTNLLQRALAKTSARQQSAGRTGYGHAQMGRLLHLHCQVDHPNVNAKACTPGSRNSISNCRSVIGFC